MTCLSAGRCPPTYPTCCCAPAPPPDACCPTRFSRQARLRLDQCKTAGVSIALSGCSHEDVSLWLRRRGQDVWVLRYPALFQDVSGAFVFRFDAKIYDLRAGRYEAQVRVGDDPCGCLEVEVPPGCGGIASMREVAYHNAQDPQGPEGLGMFDDLLTFSAQLCRPLDPGATTLPLTPAQTSVLCAASLCRPVQLVLDDGVQRETVEFSGCTAGVPTVRRAVAGTLPLTFPKGTTLKFVWTEANVLAASEGCP